MKGKDKFSIKIGIASYLRRKSVCSKTIWSKEVDCGDSDEVEYRFFKGYTTSKNDVRHVIVTEWETHFLPRKLRRNSERYEIHHELLCYIFRVISGDDQNNLNRISMFGDQGKRNFTTNHIITRPVSPLIVRMFVCRWSGAHGCRLVDISVRNTSSTAEQCCHLEERVCFGNYELLCQMLCRPQ